ncbi:unnamed protein product [Leptosia nina]|uniref:Uncharacterized protein n=1 Tax=Leptosia nina TaxID=320188 RepID=A0AAV1JXZ1_9NEOP
MVNNWSVQATEEKFATQPQLQLSDWTTGYQWAKTDTKIRVVHSTPASTTYLIPGNNSFKIGQAEKTFRLLSQVQLQAFDRPCNQTEIRDASIRGKVTTTRIKKKAWKANKSASCVNNPIMV